jgi:hypothetical protein
MIAPDVEVEGKGIILISSEEGETEANNDKFLKDLGLVDGSILTCDDFLQSYTLKVRRGYTQGLVVPAGLRILSRIDPHSIYILDTDPYLECGSGFKC